MYGPKALSKVRPPRTLTAVEQGALLKVTREDRDTYRDHMIFSLALGTGLREFEVVALNVGDVLNRERRGRTTIELSTFKQSSEDPAPQVVTVPTALRHKLTVLAGWKRKNGESLAARAPLFVSRKGGRLTRWGVIKAFLRWRDRADLRPKLTFHSLRHTYAQNLYDREGDLEVVRAAVRHRDISSTQRYAHASLEKVAQATLDQPC